MAQASALMRAFDKNRDGQLNRVEWAPYQSLLRQHALKFQMEHNMQPPDPEEINGSFAEYDRDKDGEITLKEITGNVCPLPTAH
jgi:Ca2+-binding EF-hand superfamily protein